MKPLPFRVKSRSAVSEAESTRSCLYACGDEPACAQHELRHPHRRRRSVFTAFARDRCLVRRRILELKPERYTTTAKTRRTGQRTT